MGQEIDRDHFAQRDYDRFEANLTGETDLLGDWIRTGALDTAGPVGGFELEAWLVDSNARPAPVNGAFLERADPEVTTSELARFNVELNTSPRGLTGGVLSAFHRRLAEDWLACRQVAAGLDARIAMMGILPTLRKRDLSVRNMSPLNRYRALNRQILRLRNGQPLRIDIDGRERLEFQHNDVMLESAATSFQIHLQAAPDIAHRVFNLAQIVSAPMVAVTSNSPFFLEHDLWMETRIPLFEQAVDVRDPRPGRLSSPARVDFDAFYLTDSIHACFQGNLARYPVILPMDLSSDPLPLPHLRLHNGTIWRWNRPLVGFGPDGLPHLRIEHRVVPAGPTLADMVANAALFFGLIQALLDLRPRVEEQLPISIARSNFYRAARQGLEAEIVWPDCARAAVRTLTVQVLLPVAARGLQSLDIDQGDIDHYLDIIRARVDSGQTGADWQRAWVARHGRRFTEMTEVYLELQESDLPVSSWPV